VAVTPDTQNSLVVTKQFSYRGATKRFANRYHFEGALPIDDAHWTTLANHITDDEVAIYTDDVTIVEVTGYDASTASSTNPHGDAVFTLAMSKAGTGTWSAGGSMCPGDCAIFVRYGTPARSVKNHPIYLSNYYHGAWNGVGGGDDVQTDQLALVEAYATQWLTGYTDGTVVRPRCGPRGAVATSRVVSPVVRHRDFPA